MKDEKKTKKELIAELERLRWRIGALETSKERLKKVQEQVKELTTELAETKKKLKNQAREKGQVEAILLDSEERFRNLSEESPNMIFINHGGDILYVNRMCSQVMGYEREEFYNPDFDFLALIAPESMDLIRQNFAKHQRGKEVPPYEYRLKTKGGNILDAIITTKLIHYRGERAILGIITDITERKRTEEALSESEERYRSFVQNFQGIAFRATMDFVPIFFHGAVEQITGYRETDFQTGKPSWDQIIHPEDLVALFTEDEAKLHKIPGHTYERDYRILRKDGEIRWIHEIIQNVCDDSGKVALLQGAIYDITDRKRSEEALARAREEAVAAAMSRLMIEGMLDSVVVTDLEGRVVRYNMAFKETLGASEDLIGKVPMPYVQEHEQHKFIKGIEECLEKGFVRDIELTVMDADDEWLPVSVNSSLLRDEAGNPTGIISVVRDITERRRAENALRRSEKTAKAMLNASSDVMSLIDMDGTILAANDALGISINMQADDIIGKRLDEIFPPDIANTRLDRIREVVDSGEKVRFIDERDGMIFESAFHPVFNEQGEVERIAAHARNITEQKKAEKALRRSEETAKAILNSSSDVMSLVDLDGTVLAANKTLSARLGMDVDDLIGQRMGDLLPPDLARARLNRIGEVVDSGKIIRFIDEREGAIFESTYYPLFNEEGKVERIAANAREITEQKRAERALIQNEAQIRSLVENSPDFITMLDMEGSVLFINRTFPGHTREDVIGKCLYDFTPQEYHGQYRQIIKKITHTGQTQTLQTYFVDPQDSVRWFDNRFVPIRNEDKVSTIMLISTDITEKYLAQNELKQSEETSKAILNASSHAILLVDRDKKILSANKTFANLQNSTVKHLIGKPIGDLSLPNLRKSRMERLDEAFSSDKPVVFEDEREGQFFRHTLNQVFGDQGNVERVAIHVENITERKKSRERLRQILKELEESNADLEQFAYAASHDLMAPLGTVSGYAQLLAHRYEGKLGEDADKYIERIVIGVEGMQTLVEDILSFSRLVKRERPEGHADCNATLGQVLNNLTRAITESGAFITHDELPTVTADASQLVQLFQNLIENAIKFRGDDPPRIRISAERKGDKWLFSVSDNGIGIEPRFRERVFILFQRTDAGKKFPGTGMGLAICKKIVERHGGRIWVASTPGEGSTFYFTIPCDA